MPYINLLFVILAAFIIGAYSNDEQTNKRDWMILLNIFSFSLNLVPVLMELTK